MFGKVELDVLFFQVTEEKLQSNMRGGVFSLRLRSDPAVPTSTLGKTSLYHDFFCVGVMYSGEYDAVNMMLVYIKLAHTTGQGRCKTKHSC